MSRTCFPNQNNKNPWSQRTIPYHYKIIRLKFESTMTKWPTQTKPAHTTRTTQSTNTLHGRKKQNWTWNIYWWNFLFSKAIRRWYNKETSNTYQWLFIIACYFVIRIWSSQHIILCQRIWHCISLKCSISVFVTIFCWYLNNQ